MILIKVILRKLRTDIIFNLSTKIFKNTHIGLKLLLMKMEGMEDNMMYKQIGTPVAPNCLNGGNGTLLLLFCSLSIKVPVAAQGPESFLGEKKFVLGFFG